MEGLIGRMLGNYQIIEEIGRGGMAIVYRAVQPSLQRYVAIKVLPPQFTFDTTFVQRFQREAVAAGRLKHPNIVTIYDVGEQDGIYYIVMEYLEGVALAELIRQQGALPLQRVAHIAQQVASALDYAHSQGFIHRDIKPSNVIVGPGDHATLTDFGIVKAVEGTTITRTGMMIGTPQYMSPEQIQGHEIDYRADIYSLGIVCYQMLTGRAPFGGETPAILHAHAYEPPPPIRSLRSDLPAEVETAIGKALAKEPGARYTSTMQLAQALTIGEVIEPVTLVAPVRDIRPEIERLFQQVLIGSEEEAKAASMALVRVGTVAVEPLTDLLRDSYAYARRVAAGALGEIGDARAVEPLIGLLRDRAADVRRMAALALGKIGDARAVEPLIGLLRDPDADVRQGAVEALDKIGGPAVEPLIGLLQDADMRWVAAWILGEIGVPAMESLIGVLRDPNVDVRRVAAWALGEISDPQALPYLLWMVENDADSIVRTDAQKAIERIQEKTRRG
jgi:hypothetical protein